jgi:hypothetical protein
MEIVVKSEINKLTSFEFVVYLPFMKFPRHLTPWRQNNDTKSTAGHIFPDNA